MIRKVSVLAGIVFISTISICAQNDTINQLDNLGRKQGFWEKEYPNGKPMYRGYFKDGKPAGEMRRYHESGALKVIMKFTQNKDKVYSIFFYEDGERAGEGMYFQNQKDSLWTYYSYYTGAITSTEEYVQGIKHGKEKKFYPNGQISEEIQWERNMKNGNWLQYFEDGTLKLEAGYSFNKVSGPYTFYWPNGKLYIMGHFVDNSRHGTWSFFTDEGKKKTEIVYNYGKAQNEDEIIEKDQEFFKMVEENMGKFDEPTIEDVFPQGF
jgi:antitoxin component YwqK of YwqJK toxin-antitoxin module